MDAFLYATVIHVPENVESGERPPFTGPLIFAMFHSPGVHTSAANCDVFFADEIGQMLGGN